MVYRAEDPAIGRTVAIKTIHLDGQADSSARLRREAQLAGMLSHPNIVTIYDIQEQGDQAHIFMEFVEGQTLETLMSRGEAISPEHAVNWLDQIAAALDYAHAKGIVHRDIKPANIMIQQEHTAKVTDFGVARVNSDLTTGATLAGPGSLLGTPTYMAPEQIESERVDARADQFSLAVMAYELLTGERPFTAESLPRLMYKIVNDEPPEASRVNASLAPGVSDVLTRALRKNRDQRYADCQSFTRDLRAALARKPGWKPLPRGASESLPTLVPEPAPALRLPPPRPLDGEEPDPRPGRPLRWLTIGALLLAAIAAGVGWWYASLEVVLPAPSVKVKTPPAPTLTAPAPPPVAATQTAPPPLAEEPAATETFSVHIEATPAAAITVDGAERGCLSPCDIALTAGPHRLVAERQGYRTEFRGIEAPREGPVIFQLVELIGTLFVQSTPPGATVTVDGVAWPQKTPARGSLRVGRHKLEVHREGALRNAQEIEIREGALTSINVDWSTQQP